MEQGEVDPGLEQNQFLSQTAEDGSFLVEYTSKSTVKRPSLNYDYSTDSDTKLGW
jgi:hypothetical protein